MSCTTLDDGADTFGPAASSGASGASSGGSGSGGSSDGGKAVGASPAKAGDTSAPIGEGGGGGAADGCSQAAERPDEKLPVVAGTDLELTSDTHWTCQSQYVLQGHVLVAQGATLTIDPGVRVLGGPDALLLVERGGRLVAEGTAAEPIVFTSNRPEGARKPGDFRGIVLIGDGPSHATGEPVYNLPFSDRRAQYGGGPTGAVDGSCGSLRYVRIEFAGGNLDDNDQPGAALTLAGCGSGTIVDFVQVHRGSDGIGLFGGTVPIRHAVISRNSVGNALEWTHGYTGTIQYLVAQSLGASAALQGSNADGDAKALPVSAPRIYNATLVGSAPLVPGDHFGVLLQFGSGLVLKNSVVVGFADAAFDFGTAPAAVDVGPGKLIDISHILMSGNAAMYTASAQSVAGGASMRTADPKLATAASATAPSFQPASNTVNIEVLAPPSPFDAAATYRGAIPPDGVDWTSGWTSYPEN